MCRKAIHLITFVVVLGLTVDSVSGVVIQDQFNGAALDAGKWQLVNGADVSITQSGGKVLFSRPATQLNYLATVSQLDPAETPLTITGSVTLGPDADMDVWTRANIIANSGGGPKHVLDSGIRINFWRDAVVQGWPPILDILEKTAGVWPWNSGISDGANITGDATVVDWDFVITDDGTTITATFTQTSDPTNTLTLTGTSTTDFTTDYVAITVTNGYLNDVTIAAKVPQVGFTDNFDTPHNYLTEGLGTYAGILDGSIVALDANTTRPGSLYMSTSNAVWDPGSGPLLYVKVTGDFIATVKITDFAGTLESPLFHNDAGIMARNPASSGGLENWVSMNYFPTWTTFIARDTINGVRNELGGVAGTWADVDTFALAAQYPYIQLERKGSDFYFRFSADGVRFFIPLTDPAYLGHYDGTQTPLVVSRPDLPATLQVGIFNCTYSDAIGYTAFDDFIITPR